MKNIKVFKFGGGCLKNPDSFPQLLKIVSEEKPNIIVVSALNKTTNVLELLAKGYMENDRNMINGALSLFREYHESIIGSLLFKKDIRNEFQLRMDYLWDLASKKVCNSSGMVFDNFLAQGEIMSSLMLSWYLIDNGFKNEIVPAWQFIKTDMNFGVANVFKKESIEKLKDSSILKKLSQNMPVITQGFIAGALKNTFFSFEGITTLGREGSDYTASLIANMLCELGLGVKEVVLWKDVIGVANRNPNEKNSPTPLEYFEFLEYSKFKSMIEPGGSAEGLVHYKTVRELSEQKIPLRIKNFWKPELPGTLIS